jgi:hypothetical protein
VSDEGALLREIYPELAAELVSLLDEEGEPDLAISARDLRIFARCGCGDGFCQSFYTAPPPNGSYGPGHRCLPLFTAQGMTVLDVVGGQIMYVELIDHPPLIDARGVGDDAAAAPPRRPGEAAGS